MLLLLPQSSPVPPASSAQLQPRLVDVGFLLGLVELLPVDAGHAQHVREPQPLLSQPLVACGAALQLDAPSLADGLPSAGLVQPQRVPEPLQSPLDDDVLLLPVVHVMQLVSSSSLPLVFVSVLLAAASSLPRSPHLLLYSLP